MTVRTTLLLASALAAAIFAAPGARAFTLENADGSKADQSAGYQSAPDVSGRRFDQGTTGKDGTTRLDLGGGTTMTFGNSRSGPDYNGAQQRMFSPLRPGN